MKSALYLGLDSSTQSLSAIVIEVTPGRAQVVWQDSLVFDDELPQFGTRHGVLPSADPAVAVSSPRMWELALERMFSRIAKAGLDLTRLRAISGAAQQHGSVYLNASGEFSRAVSPIWMDSSTRDECEEITAALGGAQVLAERTGSRAFERFTGPQIRKFFETDPHAYAETVRIHLVSSFLASRLIGGAAPLDPGDASGMNLMDLHTRDWWPDAVEATATGLAVRLPRIVSADSVVGELSSQWRSRLGLEIGPPVSVVVWTGDNPSSLIGTGIVEEARVAISLGTSDTIFGLMRQPRVDAGGIGHVFGAPTGDFIGITVFKNGSLARERVRDQYGLDWKEFSAALIAAPPGNDGALMWPWFEPEITPDVPTAGVRRHELDPMDVPRNVRAIVEGQMMAMANRSRWMGVDVGTIHATGGAAANAEILQVMADVFQADVHRFEVGNSACLGAALRAWHACPGDPAVTWAEMLDALGQKPLATLAPRLEYADLYAHLRSRYDELTTWAIAHPPNGMGE